jgi:hypothetical protein
MKSSIIGGTLDAAALDHFFAEAEEAERWTWDDEPRSIVNSIRQSTKIEMPALDRHVGFDTRAVLVTKASSLNLRKAAAYYGRALAREAHFNLPLADERFGDQQHVWLLPSRYYRTMHTLIAGAVGFAPLHSSNDPAEGWVLYWAYVHPCERRSGTRDTSLVEAALPIFSEVYGDFPVIGPFTGAGRAMARRLGQRTHEVEDPS